MAASDPLSTVDSTAEGAITAHALENIALFSSLDDATLELLAHRGRLRTIPAGERIFQEGDVGREMFIVLEGAVMLSKRCATSTCEVVRVAAGDWFGEMALIDVMDRPVCATAIEPTRLCVLGPVDLTAVYRQNVKMYALLVMNIARQLSRKMRVLEGKFAQAVAQADDHAAPG